MKNITMNFIRKIKRVLKIIIGKEYFTTIDCSVDNKKFATEYGGWNIFVNEINSNSLVLSFGLGEDVSFDLDLIDNFNLKVHGFDPTPKSINWIESQGLRENFILHKFGLANFNGTIKFYPPQNPKHISHTILSTSSNEDSFIEVPVKNINSIVKALNLTNIDILKMDIEGAEYDVISDLKTTNIRPKQLLVEFHHRFEGVGLNKTRKAVNELRSIGYRLFFISGKGEEYSFIYDPYKKL